MRTPGRFVLGVALLGVAAVACNAEPVPTATSTRTPPVSASSIPVVALPPNSSDVQANLFAAAQAPATLAPNRSQIISATTVAQVRTAAWSGNNPEATDFAKWLNDSLHGPNGEGIAWWVRLELTPSYDGNLTGEALLQYRASLREALATVVLEDVAGWNLKALRIKAELVKELIRTYLFRAHVAQLSSDPIKTAVQVVIADRDGHVLAYGAVTATGDVTLQVRQ